MSIVVQYPPAVRPAPAPAPQTSVATHAARYAGQMKGGQAFFTRYRPLICPFEPLLEAVPQRVRALDIGTGNGLFLYMLHAHGKLREGIGVDISPHDIRAGQRSLAALGIDSIQLNVARETSDWPAEQFDAVSMIDVMHHVPPKLQRDFFRMTCMRVGRNGRLVYKDMCRAPAWRAWANRLHDLLKAKQWIHYRAIEDIETWAHAEGLRLVTWRNVNLYQYGHELRVFQRDA